MQDPIRDRSATVEPVQVIVKAFDVIEALARDGELGVSELSERTGLTKSSIYRFVRTLIQLGYVKQNEKNDKYDLTIRLFQMGSSVLGQSDVLAAAGTIIEQLSQETKEAIHVAVLDGSDIVYVDTADSAHHALTMSPRIGGRTPAHCTALGRVLLSDKPDEEIRNLYQSRGLEPRTRDTVTDLGALLTITQRVREEGIAVDYEEYEEGLICVATPLRDRSGSVVAAMALAAPRVRLPQHRIEEVAKRMRRASEDVGRLSGALVRSGG